MTSSERATEALAGLTRPAGMTEFTPVGQPAHGIWGRWHLRLARGHRGNERRIWVDADAGDVLLVTADVDRFHCTNDVDCIFQGTSVAIKVLPDFADIDLKITDDTTGSRTFKWSTNDLHFTTVTQAAGRRVIESMTVSRDANVGASLRTRLLSEMQAAVRSPGEHLICLSGFWNQVYSALWAVPILLTVVLVMRIVYVIGLYSPAPEIAGVGTFVCWLFWFPGWNRRRYFARHRQVWRQIFTQGDKDGSVRRALHSIGVTLPPP